jgi:hypothetical protein
VRQNTADEQRKKEAERQQGLVVAQFAVVVQ